MSTSRRHNALLEDLAVQLREPGRSLEDDLRLLSKAAAEFLEVSRASVWLFDDGRDVLECAVQFERAEGRYASGQRLLAQDYPRYCESCAGVQALAVEDVFDDPRVCELKAYFTDAGIKAMLDAPIFVGASALGVVCHEDARGVRAWTGEEQAFAGAVAQLAGNSIAAARWRAREDALQRSEALYRSIVEDATDYIVRTGPDGTASSGASTQPWGAPAASSRRTCAVATSPNSLPPKSITSSPKPCAPALHRRRSPTTRTTSWPRTTGDWSTGRRERSSTSVGG